MSFIKRVLDYLNQEFVFYTHTLKAFKVGNVKNGIRFTKIKFYGMQPIIAPPWKEAVYKVYGVKEKEVKKVSENCKKGLWKTVMGRIVLDNHNNECFSEPYDKKLMTYKELTKGISLKKFLERLIE